MLLGIALEELASSPLNGQEVHPGRCFANLNGLNDVGVLDAFPISRFPNKTGNSRFVLTELFAKNLHGNDAMRGMLSAEDGRCSALPNFAAQGISCERSTYEVLFRHEANLTWFSRA